MATLDARYRINGVIDTANTVLENIEQLALSSGCWVTFDVHTGKWSVIINQPGSSTRSFDESNIIGGVEVSSTGLTELYNKVKITYPRGDINNATDFVEAKIPDSERYNNEPDNTLEISLNLVTDPVQALLIGSRELKQGRVDRVLKFTTDYTAIDINAGDLIDITLDSLDYNAKVFRVISTREADAASGEIGIEVTALEYDADVYNNDLIKLNRSAVNELTSIGDIGQPDAPVINIIDADTRPRLELVATVPQGLVAGMEFWLSGTNTLSNFILQATKRPPTGGVYAANASVSLDVTNVNAGNVFARVRAINSKTSSPYSPTSSGTFAPVQITSAVDANTAIRGPSGLPLTLLGLTSLLTGVDNAFQGNTAANSLNRAVGNALSSDATFGNQMANNLASQGFVTDISANGTSVSGNVNLIGTGAVIVTGNTAANTVTFNSAVSYSNIATNDGNITANVGNVNIEFFDSFSNVNGDTSIYFAAGNGYVGAYAKAGVSTLLFCGQTINTNSTGPWPQGSPLTITVQNAAFKTAGNAAIFVDTLFSFEGNVANGGAVDPFQSVTCTVFVDNTAVANSTYTAINAKLPLDQITLKTPVIGVYAPNQAIKLEYSIEAEQPSQVKIEQITTQFRGLVDLNNYTRIT